MSFIVPAVLGGLALAVMALVSLAAARKGRHPAASHQLGTQSQPRILVHSINEDRCTGCDACVAVCPTNVLDLVSNKSRVLRFQDCIQCEACMWACPTTALVMHLEGTEPPALKMPELDENFQTAVPGQYLIGEVAGKPLVKNAANLGRLVVEHMLRSGLQPLGQSGNATRVDVAIVGSGPGGLSAALTCIQRGLSYVLLEKEQLVASTISRYPKGKFVMAEPYDVRNLSLLPVYDSSKEQLVAAWEELIQKTGVAIRKGEPVEEIAKKPDGMFHVRTTVAAYQAQRVVLGTGTRGKPRTVGAPGENLPKVQSLLEDPDDYRGKPVIVIGGGDSAVEAAMALADAGAKVVLAYRGNSFNRCAPKNRQAVESYDAQRRIKVRYQANVVEFTEDKVTLAMADGTKKTYPNEAAFVLIGSDPPISWLQKVGVNFVERPHSYQMGKTDDLVMRFLGNEAVACPENAADAAALILHGQVPQGAQAAQPVPEPTSGRRNWLRTATSMFTVSRKMDEPMSLSEFAKRSKPSRQHTGTGRRDALPAAERTRILRMLRDEGGRIAYDESRIDIQAIPPRDGYMEDSPPPEFLSPGPPPAAPVPAQRLQPYQQQPYQQQPYQQPQQPYNPLVPAPPPAPSFVPPAARSYQPAEQGSLRPGRSAQPVRPAFNEEPTRQVDSDASLATLLRKPPQRPAGRGGFGIEDNSEDATRAVDMSALAKRDMRAAVGGSADYDEATQFAQAGQMQRPRQQQRPQRSQLSAFEEPTRAVNMTGRPGAVPPGRPAPSQGRPAPPQGRPGRFDGYVDQEEATRAVDVAAMARQDPRLKAAFDEEATRAVDLKGYDKQYDSQAPEHLSDVDWDID